MMHRAEVLERLRFHSLPLHQRQMLWRCITVYPLMVIDYFLVFFWNFSQNFRHPLSHWNILQIQILANSTKGLSVFFLYLFLRFLFFSPFLCDSGFVRISVSSICFCKIREIFFSQNLFAILPDSAALRLSFQAIAEYPNIWRIYYFVHVWFRQLNLFPLPLPLFRTSYGYRTEGFEYRKGFNRLQTWQAQRYPAEDFTTKIEQQQQQIWW